MRLSHHRKCLRKKGIPQRAFKAKMRRRLYRFTKKRTIQVGASYDEVSKFHEEGPVLSLALPRSGAFPVVRIGIDDSLKKKLTEAQTKIGQFADNVSGWFKRTFANKQPL
ncbi:hypothetical protein A6E13_16500 [Aliivibrio fischeri]|uniref:hypothetical protein n=1 Tax=Aliivibrio fischeri TaxID=668 RepID=UPI00080D912F|nr:hypothetical protein [Aliivibrio fischeri]OCH31822.1 hypothetical protein A6E13_16500 [Aliivibrio fischeri]